nr:type III secretion protein HrpB4 [Paraburkholderia phenoliruptrix]
MAPRETFFGCVMTVSTVSLSAVAEAVGTGGQAVPPAAFPFSRTAAALAAWQRNAREAARWAHPSWWAPALDVAPEAMSASFNALFDALAGAQAGALAACSRALLRAAQVPMPGFESLRAPNPVVLDALPVHDGLRVLRMRALLLRRAEVRRLIDKPSRRRLAQWVGVPLERIGAAPTQVATAPARGPANAPAPVPAHVSDATRLVARGHLPPLEEIDGERLACEGYALIARDRQEAARSAMSTQASGEARRQGEREKPREAARHGEPEENEEYDEPRHRPRAPCPCPLLRLALPRDLPQLWPAASARELDAGGTTLLFAQLPELLPEWAWLFG